MTDQELWADIDDYLCDALVAIDDALEATQRTSDEAGLPQIAVAPNQGKLLHLYARMIGARRILEIGTLGGYSGIWMARALPTDGRLVTLEYSPLHAEVAAANFARAGVEHLVDLRVGAAAQTLPALVDDEPFDLVFIDADKQSMPEYFGWAVRLTRPGGVIICDNVVRDGRVIDPNGDDMVQGVRATHELIAAEPRVTATAIQTVGSKGHDGFTIALRLDEPADA